MVRIALPHLKTTRLRAFFKDIHMTATQTWTYLITYDLRAPGRDYPNLFEGIKKLANGWAHPLESVWLVRSGLTQSSIRDALKDHLDANDVLLVFEVKPDQWASFNLSPTQVDWLKKHAA